MNQGDPAGRTFFGMVQQLKDGGSCPTHLVCLASAMGRTLRCVLMLAPAQMWFKSGWHRDTKLTIGPMGLRFISRHQVLTAVCSNDAEFYTKLENCNPAGTGVFVHWNCLGDAGQDVYQVD